ncbi:MAG: alpha/beta hydrolase-fold protein [Bacteroidota bacterium]
MQVWEAALPIPQLNRSRRVWVYLPQDYATSGKDYRVLYMHDGQNVFDAATSFVGEWEVDESLTQRENEGKESAIVVAIDNGGVHRLDEYSPFVNAQFGGGEGDAYLDFIVHTLKPQIDSAFRTLDGPEHTGIMGSSMGGVISHYAHFRHPDVFGKAGIFSPAYWFSDGFFSHTTATGKVGTPRLYLLAGALETQIANGTAAMFDTLQALGFNAAEAVVSIPSDGEHSEWFWAREFPAAFEWLFPEAPPTGLESPSASAVRLYPNPARNVLYVEAEGPAAVRVFDLLGRPLLAQTIVDRGTIDLQNISGVHQLVVHIRQHNRVQVQRILKL